jgi:DNA transformation protein
MRNIPPEPAPGSLDMARGGTHAATQSVAHVIDLLDPWAAVVPRRMFSGIGLFRDGVMFGLVIGDTLYFKTDDANRGDYEAAGTAPFSYRRGERGTIATSYHAVPPDLIEDGEELLVWARRAYDAALRRRDPAPRRRKPVSPRKPGRSP